MDDLKRDRIENAIRHIQTATDVDPRAAELAVEALKAQLSEEDTTSDCISRQAAIDALMEKVTPYGLMDENGNIESGCKDRDIIAMLKDLPSVQPESLSDAYMKAVWTWLLDYQIKAAELKGRYTPYEVLSWVANDWRKEHDGSD